MAHDHHPSAAGAHSRTLVLVLGITGAFFVVELVAGIATHSLVLVADAGHLLTDVAGLGLTLGAIRIGARASTARKTYGYYRVEVLAALLNCLLLAGVATYILYEAWRRLHAPPAVAAIPMLFVACAGLGVNVLCFLLLRRGAHESLNVHGVLLEIMSDLLSSAATIATAVIILTTGWRLADPLFSAAIGLFILPRTFRLLRSTVDILLEATPEGINMAEVQGALLALDGVTAVHDLHVWTVTSGFVAMSGHLISRNRSDTASTILAADRLLREQFGIDHVTIQMESEDLARQLGETCMPGGERCYSEPSASGVLGGDAPPTRAHTGATP